MKKNGGKWGSWPLLGMGKERKVRKKLSKKMGLCESFSLGKERVLAKR